MVGGYAGADVGQDCAEDAWQPVFECLERKRGWCFWTRGDWRRESRHECVVVLEVLLCWTVGIVSSQ